MPAVSCRRAGADNLHLNAAVHVLELQLAQVAAAIVLIAIPRAGHLGPPHRRTGIGQRHQHAIAALGIERAEREKLRWNGSRRHRAATDSPAAAPGGCSAGPALASASASAFAALPSSAASRLLLRSCGAAACFGCGGGGNKMLNNSMIATDSIRNAMKRR